MLTTVSDGVWKDCWLGGAGRQQERRYGAAQTDQTEWMWDCSEVDSKALANGETVL